MPIRHSLKSRTCSTASSVSTNNPSLECLVTATSIMSSTVVALHGKGVARGYAIGRAVVMGAASLEVAHYRIAPGDVAAESERLTQALSMALADLQQMADSLPADAPRELGAMLNVHCLLLADPMLAEQTRALIKERHYNAEWALATQGQILGEQFEAMED